MYLNVELTEQEEANLLERAKDSVRKELTQEALLKYAQEASNLPAIEFLRQFSVCTKAEHLGETMVKDLSRNDKLVLVLNWLMYEKLGG